MASADTTSAGNRSAIAAATSDLPLAVGPNSPTTSSGTEPRADEVELLVARPGRTEVGLDAAVAPLELLEHAPHGRGRGLCDATEPLQLLLALCGGEPRLVTRLQALLAQ